MALPQRKYEDNDAPGMEPHGAPRTLANSSRVTRIDRSTIAQNDPRFLTEHAANDASYDPLGKSDPRLAGEQYLNSEGLPAQATDFSRPRRTSLQAAHDEQAAIQEETQAQEEALRSMAYDEAVETARSVARRSVARNRAALGRREASTALQSVKGLSTAARWGSFGVACTLWVWQFTLAAISLTGFAALAMSQAAIEGNVFTRTVNSALKFVGVDILSMLPFDIIGYGFWAVATMIGIASFFGFFTWFLLTGVDLMHSEISILIMALTLAACIMPILNLLPAVPVWVAYTNARATIRLFSEMTHKGKGA